MDFKLKSTFCSAAVAIGLWSALQIATVQIARADDAWKPDQVEFVVPNSPGGASDTIARVLQKVLTDTKQLQAPSVVLNKPGGAGNITLNYIKERPGQGGEMAVLSVTQPLNYIIGTSTMNYPDFTPIAGLVGDYVGFAVRADSPIKDGHDLIDRLKKDPQSVSFAITGIGGLNHIPALQLARSIGINGKQLKTPVFSSTGDSTTALLGGHVDVVIGSAGNLMAHEKSGQIRILAVSAPDRLPGDMGKYPTWKEQGADVVFSSWRGLWGPKNMTPAQIAYWDKALAVVVKDPVWQKSLNDNGWSDVVMNSAQFKDYLDSQEKDLVSLLQDMGLAKNVN